MGVTYRSAAARIEQEPRLSRGGPVSTTKPPDIDLGQYKFGWHDPAHYVFEPKRGLNADVVREISFLKQEPEWMTRFRLRALEIFERKPMPTWGGDLSEIDFQNIFYFIRASE